MHLTDPLKAVRDMSRVARNGGTVAAFEPGRFESIYIFQMMKNSRREPVGSVLHTLMG